MTDPRDAELALRRSQEQVALIRQQSDHEDAELLRWLISQGIDHIALTTGAIDCANDPAGARAAIQAARLDTYCKPIEDRT